MMIAPAFRRVALAAAATFVLAAGSLSSGAAAQGWRGWNIHTPEHPNGRGMDHFADTVARTSEGRLALRTFHNGQLGQQDEAIQQIRLGTIDFASFNLNSFTNVAPAAGVVALPFLFRDNAHSRLAIDGVAGQEVARDLEQAGLVALAWYDSGVRNLYSVRPVHSLSDMQGLRVRVQNSNLWLETMRALGATAVSAPLSAVIQRFQSNAIDAAENNWVSYHTVGHFEGARFMTMTQHSAVPEVLAVSRTRWNRLPEADRALLRAAAVESATLQRDLMDRQEAASRDHVIANGITVIEPTDRAAWIAAMDPVYARFAGTPRLQGLVESIRALR
ncbi:TRAP transporter substrate-binding protein DctP [Falsiroseomonas stagni]|uniref:Tripartite ATP-independent transporter solute receptor, DctP family n=1 Tax=Falsiroseomonas stagni DSM 19981 TaxID=1123062 RepID=A0A1I4BUD2_9PROT|nr:TRAP transporter substrate-binding protein DctP [Falsiroseomonas stagni]SFK72394.1 tripartite ATP-independent transporter solute receptor, DctP family [Falsiroseomonas stagni DSM 19981]